MKFEDENKMKMDFCDYIEDKISKDENFGVDDSKITLVSLDVFIEQYTSSEKEDFAINRLYRYESDKYGPSNIGNKSRDFCKRMARLTGLRMLRFNEIDFYNSANPGFGPRGSSSYNVFNWRGGPNCVHKWVRYLFDPETGNTARDTSQPTQKTGSSNGGVPYL